MSTTLESKSTTRFIVGVAALVLVAGLALAVSSNSGNLSFTNTAQEGSGGEGAPSERAPLEGQGRPCRGGPGGIAAHAIHGELIVPERPEPGEDPSEPGTEPTEFETIVLDAGEVTAVSDSSLTLERPDGEEVTVKITDDTKQREDAVIEVGDKVRVIADTDGNARAIMTRPDRPAGGAQAGAESGAEANEEGRAEASAEANAETGGEGEHAACPPHRGGPRGARGGGTDGQDPGAVEGSESSPEDVSTPA